jgi:HAD superfamily hydrolase (TIGR01509 family)
VDVAAVVFDMDGVLVDSEGDNFEAMRTLLARHGIDYTEAVDATFLGRRNVDVFAAYRASHGLRASDAELDGELTRTLTARVRNGCTPMPGVPDVPRRLHERGYRLALASSAVPALIVETVRALALEDVFAIRVSGSEVERGKPAPDVFVEAARRLGVPPARCLVVEDSRNGMLAALAAGMPCAVVPCAATRGQDFAGATLRLRALPELLPVLTSPAR